MWIDVIPKTHADPFSQDRLANTNHNVRNVETAREEVMLS